ncbi:MAG: cytochrome c oxidase subunit I [Actinobacteria bacterium]|nr:cytochrome c oxidase subunit I [Actinomycetota bacterium]
MDAAIETRPGVFKRPTATTGAWSWFSTVDHKKIGILYGATAILFFVVGGIEALLIRLQLAKPDGNVLSPSAYNQAFTMHGITMIFLVVMPLGAAFANYLLPLMIGARDVAFPRLNAFSYWVFALAGIFIYSSFFLGGAPNGGWFGYAPLSTKAFSPGHNMDFYALGLLILGVASTASAVNLLVTVVNMRAPGMSLMRMPVFVWMVFVVQFLLVFALPVLTVGLIQLIFDRLMGTNFFNATKGGDPLLWQHLFWLFGHPEVYILILPAMGIVSEVLPTFSRKPLFGYPVVVFSGIAIGFMGWGVWAHHMFATGLGPVANSAFAVSTMFIAVPTGVKVFNWTATMWGGSLRLKTPMLFSIGFVTMFIIGGLSGVTHAVVPSDYQQTDTYYIVAHFHYVLFGGAMFGLFSGVYYWWPKVFGKLLNERVGKLHFWLMLIGFNLTFAPFHILGLQGMVRRTYTYPKGRGWDGWNFVSTVGAFVIALSLLVFFYNVIVTRRRGAVAGNDPWDARTIEWTTSSPPPEYNFAEIPVIHSVDDFWHRKYVEDKEGRLVRVPSGGADEEEHDRGSGVTDGHGDDHHAIHMPSPSYFPLLAAIGMPIFAYGLIYSRILIAAGALIMLTGLYGWALEPGSE